MSIKALPPLPILKAQTSLELKEAKNEEYLLRLEEALGIDHSNIFWLKSRVRIELDRKKRIVRICMRGGYARMIHAFLWELERGAKSKNWKCQMYEGRWVGNQNGGRTRIKGIELYYP